MLTRSIDVTMLWNIQNAIDDNYSDFSTFVENGEASKMTEVELPFRSEYAKSGRSSCKACKTNIEKAQLRLAAMVQVILRYIHPISINFNYYKKTHILMVDYVNDSNFSNV